MHIFRDPDWSSGISGWQATAKKSGIN